MKIPNPFDRKSGLERLLDTLDDSLGSASDLPSSSDGFEYLKPSWVGQRLRHAREALVVVRHHCRGTFFCGAFSIHIDSHL